MIYGITADVPRQLFTATTGLRGRAMWHPRMSTSLPAPLVGHALDPDVYRSQPVVGAGVWPSEQFAVPNPYRAEPPQQSFYDTAAVFGVLVGAVAGYGVAMLSRGQHRRVPQALAMLGVAGQDPSHSMPRLEDVDQGRSQTRRLPPMSIRRLTVESTSRRAPDPQMMPKFLKTLFPGLDKPDINIDGPLGALKAFSAAALSPKRP